MGIALIEECIKNDIVVYALVNPKSKNISRVPVHRNIFIKECSLSEIRNFDICDEKADAFFHFAWSNTHSVSERNDINSHVDNIRYSLDAVELASKFDCKVFLGAGSQAEFGNSNEILTEDTKCCPETAYGISKFCAGKMTRISCERKKIRHIWTRILSSYGPNYLDTTVINYTITEILNGRSPLLSSCEQKWDFIYNTDVAKAFLLLAQYGYDGNVYIIGSGHSEPLKNYLIKIRDMINPEIDLKFGAANKQSGKIINLSCDISKLKNHTGFSIQTSFEQGIKETIEWNIKNLKNME